MPDLLSDILWAFAILSAKHTAADFFLQTPYQYLNKGTYGHPGGLLHAAIHAVLTPLVYLVLAPSTLLIALLNLLWIVTASGGIIWLRRVSKSRAEAEAPDIPDGRLGP